MLIKLGAIIGALSGRLGGMVGSRNRYGTYLRQGSIPVNPNSPDQQFIRATFQSVVNAWSAVLTAPQRAAWDVYAANIVMKNKLGEDIFITGFNHYIRSNVPLIQAGEARVDDGPIVLSLPEADETFAITASEATQLVSVTFDNTLAWANEDNAHLLVQCGLPRPVTQNFFNGPYRFMDTVAGNATTAPTSPATMTAPFTIAAGQQITCRARILRADARLSSHFLGEITVAS